METLKSIKTAFATDSLSGKQAGIIGIFALTVGAILTVITH